ncbi:hypothetical protein CRYUN_Cryun19dG0081000 [Craigia yunnanensis]
MSSRKKLSDKEVQRESVIQLKHSVQSNKIDPSRGHGVKEGILGINDDGVNIGTNRKLSNSETLLNTELLMVVAHVPDALFSKEKCGVPSDSST